MRQTFHCQHCHTAFLTVFDVFFHCYTNHIHADIGLTPTESKDQLKGTVVYRVKGEVCPN